MQQLRAFWLGFLRGHLVFFSFVVGILYAPLWIAEAGCRLLWDRIEDATDRLDDIRAREPKGR